jgi:hypothetical protein
MYGWRNFPVALDRFGYLITSARRMERRRGGGEKEKGKEEERRRKEKQRVERNLLLCFSSFPFSASSIDFI